MLAIEKQGGCLERIETVAEFGSALALLRYYALDICLLLVVRFCEHDSLDALTLFRPRISVTQG
jgi:hypothetical protein